MSSLWRCFSSSYYGRWPGQHRTGEVHAVLEQCFIVLYTHLHGARGVSLRTISALPDAMRARPQCIGTLRSTTLNRNSTPNLSSVSGMHRRVMDACIQSITGSEHGDNFVTALRLFIAPPAATPATIVRSAKEACGWAKRE